MKQYKFEIPALNTEKLLNKLVLEFDIFDIKKQDNVCSFFCKSKQKKQIEKILKKYGFSIKFKSYFGLAKHLKNISSLGIIIGIIVSVVLYIISTFFISNVLIVGNLTITSKEIMQVLENYNINKWSLKSSIDVKNLQQELEEIKYVSYASVIIKGNALIINIKEQLTNNEIVNMGTFQPLVSKYDGKITSIKLIQGTSAVKVGDIVKLGDVLVYPYVLNDDGTTLSVQPLANITCDVWITTRLEVKDKEIKKIRTNNVISNYSLSFMGINFFNTNQKVTFSNYETEKKECYLSNCILPIKIKYTNCYEYIFKEFETNFEENKNKYIEKTRQMSLLNVKEYDIIKDESYVINKQDDTNIIIYTITLNKLIT